MNIWATLFCFFLSTLGWPDALVQSRCEGQSAQGVEEKELLTLYGGSCDCASQTLLLLSEKKTPLLAEDAWLHPLCLTDEERRFTEKIQKFIGIKAFKRVKGDKLQFYFQTKGDECGESEFWSKKSTELSFPSACSEEILSSSPLKGFGATYLKIRFPKGEEVKPKPKPGSLVLEACFTDDKNLKCGCLSYDGLVNYILLNSAPLPALPLRPTLCITENEFQAMKKVNSNIPASRSLLEKKFGPVLRTFSSPKDQTLISHFVIGQLEQAGVFKPKHGIVFNSGKLAPDKTERPSRPSGPVSLSVGDARMPKDPENGAVHIEPTTGETFVFQNGVWHSSGTLRGPPSVSYPVESEVPIPTPLLDGH